ncbi:TPA: tail protein X [Escherichia coli]|uniref:Tail protein X n=1 Tax=Escherichia coli TaxID=562 RepID=A0ACD5GBJ5_ECOLX|nr:tail protein X [Escherichia coli]EFI2815381.1 phage tail protein [Escherichia coli]EFI2826816.1 phage tail protein [Escherichia coli]EFI2861495.1 phage tail protein [Escherichia coli]EFN4421508.1 phage tail protein [Escherichia coli]EFN5058846.1 phage tail protein [Escherichia coli]
MPTIYLTRDGDVLDAVCADFYGTADLSATVSMVLEANQGLAELGAIYAAGIQILLPDPEPQVTESPYTLWE